MAVNPIDLQTLYVHMGQHGKDQANTRAAVVHGQELQIQKMAKEQDVEGHSVNKMATADEEGLAVKTDEGQGQKPGKHLPGKKKEPEQSLEEAERPDEFQDPSLGKHIDITG